MTIDPFVVWGIVFVLATQFVYHAIQYGRDSRPDQWFGALTCLAALIALLLQVA